MSVIGKLGNTKTKVFIDVGVGDVVDKKAVMDEINSYLDENDLIGAN